MEGIVIPTAVIVALIVGLVVIAAIIALRPQRRAATALDAVTEVAGALRGSGGLI